MLANNCNGEANIETPPQYIFVFVNEIFNKITQVFLLSYILNFDLMRSISIHPLEKYLDLLPENISQAC